MDIWVTYINKWTFLKPNKISYLKHRKRKGSRKFLTIQMKINRENYKINTNLQIIDYYLLLFSIHTSILIFKQIYFIEENF